MEVDEFMRNLDSALNKCAAEMEPVMVEAALNAKAILVRRIQREGFSSKYSSNKIPTYFLKGFKGKDGKIYPPKYLNASGKAFLEAEEKRQYELNKRTDSNFRARVSWASFRQAQGLQVQFVDLTYTGKMLQNWRLPGSYREDLKVGGYVGGTDDETKNKLKWNKRRYPNFDKLTDEEKSLIANHLIRPRLLAILNKNLYQK